MCKMLNLEIVTATLIVGVMLNSINSFPHMLATNYTNDQSLIAAGQASMFLSALAGCACIIAAGVTLGGRRHVAASVILATAFFMFMLNRVYAKNTQAYYAATRGIGAVLLTAAPIVFIKDHPAAASSAAVAAVLAALLPPPINVDNTENVTYAQDPALVALSATLTSMLLLTSNR